jgi:hypothetical protein
MLRQVNFMLLLSFMLIESFSCMASRMVQKSKKPEMGFHIVFPKGNVMLPSGSGHERYDSMATQQRLSASQNSPGSVNGNMQIHSKTPITVPRSHQSLRIRAPLKEKTRADIQISGPSPGAGNWWWQFSLQAGYKCFKLLTDKVLHAETGL